jgi:alanine racemase
LVSGLRAEARIDLGAIERNVVALRGHAPTAAVMAVVKADGYGHGAVESARAALRGGASWLGVAYPSEAAALRAAGIEAPVLAWLLSPYEDLSGVLRAGVDVSVSDVAMLEHVVAQAALTGVTARVHLKVDTGLSRAGATMGDWPDVVARAVDAQAEGAVTVAAVWSHLACADVPRHPSNAAQLAVFAEALSFAESRGLRPELRHLANSAATLTLPESHFDLVRPGVAVYGVSPGPEVGTSAELGLTPAMTLAARVALVKKVPAGVGVSYGHRYHTRAATTLALVPLGYADGVPRNATNVGPVQVAGGRYTVSGTVCMDQFVVDVGDRELRPGDEVLLFGAGESGEPTAEDWARATGTIAYEIITRIGARTPRVFLGGAAG